MTPTRTTLLALLLFLATGCDLLGGEKETEPVTASVYVANQGNFGDDNGTITVYDPQTGGAATPIQDVGSIIQGIEIRDGRLYVMANSANHVDVYDLETNERTGRIGDIRAPRYMAFVSPTLAYVTNLYGGEGDFTGGNVSVVNVTTQTKLLDVPIGDNPEGIAVVGGRAYVANSGFGAGHTLSVLNTSDHTIADTIDVECDGPRFLLRDLQDEVFVFCTGRTLYDENFNVIGQTDGAVRILNGRTGEIIERLELDGQMGAFTYGQDAYFSPETEEIFAVQGNTILRFDTATNRLAGEIGPIEGDPISAVAYDAVARRLYLGRSAGFTESGAVTIHERDGSQVGAFTAGIHPTHIAFRLGEQ